MRLVIIKGPWNQGSLNLLKILFRANSLEGIDLFMAAASSRADAFLAPLRLKRLLLLNLIPRSVQVARVVGPFGREIVGGRILHLQQVVFLFIEPHDLPAGHDFPSNRLNDRN